MKILLINPRIPITFWNNDYAMDITGAKSMLPPLGLITVAALLPQEYDIELLDLNIEKINKKKIINADLVMISAMIIQQDSFEEVTRICQDLGTQVAAGGPYVTSAEHEIKNVDYFILNEGEITLPEFIKDYEAGTPKKVYSDETKPDITKTPVPRFDLLKLDKYNTMSLQNSRGCPFNCEFCDIIELFGRVPRFKTPEQFTNEMAVLMETGYRGQLFIVDDNFIGHKGRVKMLLKEIIAWQIKNDYPFSLTTEASMNLAEDEELMDLMVEAGFNIIFVGIETPDKSVLEMTNKQANVKIDLVEHINRIQKKGIEVMGGFILGFDNEPENIFQLQIDLITAARIPVAMIGLMLALPRTQLYRRLKKEGRLLEETHGNNTHNFDMNFIPTLDKDVLVEGYKNVMKHLYDPKNYFQRCLDLLAELPNVKPEKAPDQKVRNLFRDIRTVIYSIFIQGFSRYGIHYFRFLNKARKVNSFKFAYGIGLAVRGHHFIKLTREIMNVKKK